MSPNRSGNIIYFQGGQYNVKDNTVTFFGSNAEERTQKLKREYSNQVVLSQAKRLGWKVTKSKEEYAYVITKRTY